MPYNSLYRRFRPDTFDKVIGQDHIIRILKNQIKTNTVGHSYLFTGTRGTGKTSVAKILAKAINCEHPADGSPCMTCNSCVNFVKYADIDIYEIDAASNNGVDDVRNLKDNTRYRPVNLKHKVFIIDEVHMLTINAFNALLKVLEEPPEYCLFILATTEIHKVPQTIISRCLVLDFRLIPHKMLTDQLKFVFDNLKVKYQPEALSLIARAGEGSVRDTLSIAEMCMSYCGGIIKYDDVLEILGVSDPAKILDIINDMLGGNCGQVLLKINDIITKGKSVNALFKDIINNISSIIYVKSLSDLSIIDDIPKDSLKTMDEIAKRFSNTLLNRALDILVNGEGMLRYAIQPKTYLEMICLKASSVRNEIEPDRLILRLKALEEELDKLKTQGLNVNVSGVNQNNEDLNNNIKTDNSVKSSKGGIAKADFIGNKINKEDIEINSSSIIDKDISKENIHENSLKDITDLPSKDIDKNTINLKDIENNISKETDKKTVNNQSMPDSKIMEAIEKDESINCLLDENKGKTGGYRLNNDKKADNLYKDKAIDLLAVWGRIVVFLKNNGKFTLYSMASEVNEKDISVDGNTVLVTLTDEDEYNFFTRQENIRLIQELLKRLLDSDAAIEFSYPQDESGINEAVEKMEDLFDKYSLNIKK